MANSGNGSQCSLDDDPLANTLITYLQEHDQTLEAYNQVFLEKFRQLFTQLKVEMVTDMRENMNPINT